MEFIFLFLASPVFVCALILVGAVILFILIINGLRMVRFFRGRRQKRVDAGAKCVCGYALQGLDIPRCPECGRAIGFKKTFAELGISEVDVVTHAARRRAELGKK